nr:hypothetical protein [uncultured Flavobacterium sp.]
MSKLYTLSITLIFSALFCNAIYAQPQTGQFINISAGLGIADTTDDIETDASGFYAQAEYVYAPLSWFGVRPYAGVIIASGESDEKDTTVWRIKSNAALLGVKARLVAPIPYVAPFFESGIGISIGSFETYTEYTAIKKSGVLYHIPFSLGLAIGRNHNYEVKFSYYVTPTVNQFSGAAAVGFSFPVD